MSQPNTELASLVDAVRASHDELDHSIIELREVCTVLRTGGSPDTELPPLLERFSEELLLHLAEEELEETFGSLLTDQPRVLYRVERLQKEHVDMTDTVTRLVELCRSESAGIDLAVRIDQLLDKLAVHEHAENTLMQELVLLDEGDSGD